jgi:hypothetical protein
MSEWLKEHAWKACVGETLPRVRIPLSPPDFLPTQDPRVSGNSSSSEPNALINSVPHRSRSNCQPGKPGFATLKEKGCIFASPTAPSQARGLRTNTTTFHETHRPFIRENGSIIAIPVPSVDAQAADINDSGIVVGTMKASGGLSTYHAWVYLGGAVTNVNSLVVPGSGLHIAFAYAINNLGQIAGVAIDG